LTAAAAASTRGDPDRHNRKRTDSLDPHQITPVD
jgi:hypothetical protein